MTLESKHVKSDMIPVVNFRLLPSTLIMEKILKFFVYRYNMMRLWLFTTCLYRSNLKIFHGFFSVDLILGSTYALKMLHVFFGTNPFLGST